MRAFGFVGILSCTIALAIAPGRASAWRMEDSLRGSSSSGNAVGGTFTPEGWRVDARTDRIWWEIPRLGEGSIEFTVSNVTLANLPLNDHEIFAMYEAGYGITEPIDYSPEFRNNHYKCMIRVYGTAEVGREGQQKLMWGMCPSGAPGYDACGCASFFEEPFGGDATWDGSPQRFRVEWAGGITRLLRNDVEVVSIDWSESGLIFGPDTVHFSLGTSRADAVGDAGMPIGAVFSDVVVDGIEGPLATCMGPLDAGVPEDAGAESDAGTSDDAGAEGDAGAGADGGVRPDGSTARDAGSTGRTSEVDGGCGCAVPLGARDGTGPLVATVAVISAIFLRLRRRRSR